MYVCICHAITDSQVKQTCQGACHPAEIHKRMGVRPQCGRCLHTIRDIMLDEAQSTMPMAAE